MHLIVSGDVISSNINKAANERKWNTCLTQRAAAKLLLASQWIYLHHMLHYKLRDKHIFTGFTGGVFSFLFLAPLPRYRATEGSAGEEDVLPLKQPTGHALKAQVENSAHVAHLRSYCEALWEEEEDLRTLGLILQIEFRLSKSHSGWTRVCDTSSDPTVIHRIWKQFLEGLSVHPGRAEHPFTLPAEETEQTTWREPKTASLSFISLQAWNEAEKRENEKQEMSEFFTK